MSLKDCSDAPREAVSLCVRPPCRWELENAHRQNSPTAIHQGLERKRSSAPRRGVSHPLQVQAGECPPVHHSSLFLCNTPKGTVQPETRREQEYEVRRGKTENFPVSNLYSFSRCHITAVLPSPVGLAKFQREGED